MSIDFRKLEYYLSEINRKKPSKILDLTIYYLFSFETFKNFYNSIVTSKIGHTKKDFKFLEHIDIGSQIQDDSYYVITNFIKEYNYQQEDLVRKTQRNESKSRLSLRLKQKYIDFIKEFGDKLEEYLKHIDTDEDDSNFKRLFMDTENFLNKDENKGYLILYYLSTKGDTLLQKIQECISAFVPFQDDIEVKDTKSNEYYYLMLMGNFGVINMRNFIRAPTTKLNVFRNLIRIYLDIYLIEDLEETPKKMIYTILNLMFLTIKKDNYKRYIGLLRKFKYNYDLYYIHSLNYIYRIFKNEVYLEENIEYFRDICIAILLGQREYGDRLFVLDGFNEEARGKLRETMEAARGEQPRLTDTYLTKLLRDNAELQDFLIGYIKTLYKNGKYLNILKIIYDIPKRPDYLYSTS